MLLAAFVQFCLFLHHRDITTAHEGRVAATAREMLDRGEWLIPHLNDQPRLHKPPLAYWVTAGTWSLAGSRQVWLARFPAALGGAIATLLVMDLARRVLGARAGLTAGVVWISTWFIVDEFRKSMADPYLAFFTLLTIWSWITAETVSNSRLSRSLIMVSYLSLALGALAKGPLILLHVAVALVPCYLIRRRRPSHLSSHLVGLVLFFLLAVAWPVYVMQHMPGATQLWLHELTATSGTSRAKSGPFWQYLANIPLLAAPWTAFALIGMVMPLVARSRRHRRALWPLIWFAATITVFSLVPMKKNVYLLPAMPAQTLLIAAAVTSLVHLPRATKHDRLLNLFFIACALAAIATIALTIYFVMSIERFEIEPPAPLMAAGAVTLFLLLGFRTIFPHPRSLRTIFIIGAAFALGVHAMVAWVEPDYDKRRSDRPFAESAIRLAEGEALVLIGEGLREDVLFYLGRTLPTSASIEHLPADFRGVAIVTADARSAVRRSDRGDEIATSAPRAEKDRLYLYRFPKAPPDEQQQRR